MSDLDRLFYWRGIADQYQNYRGEQVSVPLENRMTLLETMGVDASSDSAVSEAAYELDVAPWRQYMPTLQTFRVSNSAPGQFFVNLHPARLSHTLKWRVLDDSGVALDSGAVIPNTLQEGGDYLFNGLRYSRRMVPTAVFEPGYYTVEVTIADELPEEDTPDDESVVMKKVVAKLALVPETVHQPQWLEKGKNPWGFIVQLYTLRSDSDWGIGDFSDLKQLIVKAAAAGAEVIGLNPVHALLPDVAESHSPYSPSDRRFISPLYIDPAVEPDFLKSEKLHKSSVEKKRNQQLKVLREKAFVDYGPVKDLKYSVFETMFAHFTQNDLKTNSARAESFAEFVAEGGGALQQFALFEAANNRWKNASYKAKVADKVICADPESTLFKDVINAEKEAVQFHCYLQWLAHAQLDACQQTALDEGMCVGLVRDLAVGADGGGAEAFSNPQQFCTKASVGAPPDPLAEQGQNWGLPPMDPSYLRSTGFAHYIQILRENMSRCGALRIDHAMSLMRLWWCPPGTTADHGAYVYYPFEDMLGLLCLESHLNKCAIIGEDLGVVPDEFRKAITEAGIFTNRVFYFEKENFTTFKPPERYDVHALAMVNNHDVPTLVSWWDGKDLLLRDKLNIFEEGVDYGMMLDQRQRDKQEVLNFLSDQSLLPESWMELKADQQADHELIYAILTAVSRVVSKLYVIQLEDVLLMDAPVNVPGTFKEYPNWQRKISTTIEDIFASKKAKKLFTQINSERQSISQE